MSLFFSSRSLLVSKGNGQGDVQRSGWEYGDLELIDKVNYQGHRLTTVPGFDATRRKSEVEGTHTRTRGFLTVYAGVER